MEEGKSAADKQVIREEAEAERVYQEGLAAEKAQLAPAEEAPKTTGPTKQDILDRIQAMHEKILDVLGEDNDSAEANSIRGNLAQGILDEQTLANLYTDLKAKYS